MPRVYGPTIDEETRCIHYHSLNDIVAIKFKCCNKYYPCYKCHQESEGHSIIKWPKQEFDEQAILCGVCKTELTITEYVQTNTCPTCQSSFNEGCQNHYHIYFEME
ncbi:hypothetical protein GMD78_04660 [Ornithinibacillus sp. L9]|uniref:CHY-type domain-containing protein n=1 Tax=Ornithinibacillus caprae TaxID=2678566 RepID=A0A6N8FDF3_9BACI|nr:CHY zinc finger protein [Ornithinibacillus caprae]MUK87692.1 hypothetical protein [Ornithinibacillus caprae]